MRNETGTIGSLSPIGVVAALSVAALAVVVVMQIAQALGKNSPVLSAVNSAAPVEVRATTPFQGINWQSSVSSGAPAEGGQVAPAQATADKDGISNIADNVIGALVGSYASMKAAGTYTPSAGAAVASQIAPSLRATVSAPTYTQGDIKTDADTSYKRMQTYRSDMQTALAPLLANTSYELKLYANYVDTHDAKYLAQLKGAAQNYAATAKNSVKVVVPQDAATIQVNILNALSKFGATIEAMADHADDPLAGAALLQTYESAESGMISSFNTLALYEKSKLP